MEWVVFSYLSEGWNQEVIDCVKPYADRKTRLWSFEVKLLVNRSTIWDVFFQAVSDSSWANLGYLVAAEFEGRDAIKELRMLASLHGIDRKGINFLIGRRVASG